MKMNRASFLALVGLALILVAAPAWAGGDDPLVTHPDVFVVFDTSGSMSSCGLVDCSRSRFTAAIEVLTGTFFPPGGPYYHPPMPAPAQFNDGIMDLYKDFVRFGLGSFDADGGGRWGVDTVSAYGDDTAITIDDGDANTHADDRIRGRGIKGRLAGSTNTDRCTTGARGCLIDLIKQSNPSDLIGNNVLVQEEMNRMGYHGNTPIAPSLYDARYYFENYESELAGYDDPLGRYGGNCRPQFVLLMTDGQEWSPCNNCPESGTGEFCPENHSGDMVNNCSWYGNEAYQAAQLWNIGVPVYVVAFGNMNTTMRVDMHQIARAGFGMAQADWYNPSPDFTAATRTAWLASLELPWGARFDEPKAFIVQDQLSLKLAFALILDSILAGTVSRTRSSSLPTSMAGSESVEVSAWFEMGITGITWNGFLRMDTLDDTDLDGMEEIVDSKVTGWGYYVTEPGENFVPLPLAANRRFLTVVEDPRSKTFHDIPGGVYDLPRFENDGTHGLYPFKASNQNDSAWDFDHSQMCLMDTGELFFPADTAANRDQQARYVKAYVRGVPDTWGNSGLRYALEPQLGDIFHSSPQLVGPPSPLTPDFAYEAHFQEYKLRHTMIYAGSNDGLLHAFVAKDHDNSDGVVPELTELWAFMPSKVLAKIATIRAGGHPYFVDGTPVIRDVKFPNLPVPDGNPATDNQCLEDSAGDCIMGGYRTVLVSGLRAGGDAYFALDVTDPDKPGYLWEYRTSLPPDDGNPATVHDDYLTNQCRQTSLETWARPLIGQVWLKDGAAADQFVEKNVMVVPGGYMPKTSFTSMTNCVQLMEATVAANTLHVVDMETGELMRKFIFSTNPNIEQLAQDLDDFYADVAADPLGNWMHWGGGIDFSSGDFDWAAGEGWNCGVHRHEIGTAPTVPPLLLDDQYCDYTFDSGGIAYEQACCSKGNGLKCTNMNGANNCSYRYTEYDSGNVRIWLKTEGCWMLGPGENGARIDMEVGANFGIEASASTPVAYNMGLGEFMSRVFVVSSRGRIWRLDMANAQYEANAPEGQRIVVWDSDATVDWKSTLWFDPTDLAFMNPVQPATRTSTADPAIALNEEGGLTLFFGTGSVDDLEFKPGDADYFYGIKEQPDLVNPGKWLDTGALVDVKNDFAVSERLFGKPLVVAGNVIFTTFTPDPTSCGSGSSTIYALKYNNFDAAQAPIPPVVNSGIVIGPAMRWTGLGPRVVYGTTDTGKRVNKLLFQDQIAQYANVLYWGEVL